MGKRDIEGTTRERHDSGRLVMIYITFSLLTLPSPPIHRMVIWLVLYVGIVYTTQFVAITIQAVIFVGALREYKIKS